MITFGIEYSKNNFEPDVVPYVDSDFANDPDTRSVTGYVIMCANGPIAVKSKRQSSVSTSSVQAEYQAACHVVCEVVWLRQLLKELGHEQLHPTVVFKDNHGCFNDREQPDQPSH